MSVGIKCSFLGEDGFRQCWAWVGQVFLLKTEWVRLDADGVYYNMFNSILGADFTLDGYHIDEGSKSLKPLTSYCATQKIPIDFLSFYACCYVHGSALCYIIYDNNDCVIDCSGKSSSGNTEKIILKNKAIPYGAKYIQFSTSKKYKNKSFVHTCGSQLLLQNQNEKLNTLYKESGLIYCSTNDRVPLPKDLLIESDKYYSSDGSVKPYGNTSQGYTITTSYIDLLPNHRYKLVNTKSNGHTCFYGSDHQLISAINSVGTNELEFTTPSNCAFARFTFDRNKDANPCIVNLGEGYTVRLPQTQNEPAKKSADYFGASFLGALNYQPFATKGYSHVIYYGQSLSDGHVSRHGISTTPIDGCFMLGDDVATFGTSLKPLTAANDNIGERPVVGCVNALKTLFNHTYLRDLKFIGTSCGVGDQSIESLSKEKVTNIGVETNYYHTRFLKALNNSKTAVASETIECSVIVYMQGEKNQTASPSAGSGLTVDGVQTNNKDEYKVLLKKLKENMQSDVMRIYGQKQPPLFFIYQTSVFYSPLKDMPITMAQYEFAMENDDVILLNPHYYCPTAENGGGHLNANGYRWYAEQTAKTIYQVFEKNIWFKPVVPRKITIEGKTILIDCEVPVPPLVIDTHTLKEVVGKGFTVLKNGIKCNILSVDVQNSTMLRIITDFELSHGAVVVSYAGQEQKGMGNIRDSDAWIASTEYVDDTTVGENNPPYTPVDDKGVNYYGRRYPMYNWLSNFYIAL